MILLSLLIKYCVAIIYRYIYIFYKKSEVETKKSSEWKTELKPKVVAIMENSSKDEFASNRIAHIVDINGNNMAKQVDDSQIARNNSSFKDKDNLKGSNGSKRIKENAPSLRISPAISIPLKYVCLGVLIFQTSFNILTLRYSRTRKVPGETSVYIASTAILCSELLKLIVCYFVLLQKTKSCSIVTLNSVIWKQTTENWKDGIKLAIPALLYVIQNNLLFLALTMLDAAVYQVTYQLKILTTAIFSVIMLGKKLNTMKWFSLCVLMLGVCIVQWPDKASAPGKETSTPKKLVGIVSVLLACLSSGFSGVNFEKIIKGTPLSMWMRNLQLAFFSVILAALGILHRDFEAIQNNGFFQGYNRITFLVILSQAFGGLVIGAVVKYADNILKGFATSVSIIVSSTLSYYILHDFVPSGHFVLGSTLVLLSTYLYSLPAHTS